MRSFILLVLILTCLVGFTNAAEKPNFVVIFCDDLGYGDLGCFGHPTIKTPNLDRMAGEGQKWTEFYVAASVCTPSRAGLLTGRLPIRSGMCSDSRAVLFPDSKGGLPQSEITIARMLKDNGYATACVGKWHLGHLPPYLPTSHGFDSYFGIPYSNDMDGVGAKIREVNKDHKAPWHDGLHWRDPKIEYWNVPLMRNEEVVERPANQHTITRRYTDEAVKIIKANKEKPFFLYLAHNLPHVPLFVSEEFANRSRRGLYGDVIEEIDWSVGQVMQTLKDEGLAENTLVVFTSDNGPWLVFKTQSGSAGLLRDGKGSTWEGGMREPTVFWWPGKIQPAVVAQMGSTLDLLPTFAALSGAAKPSNGVLDGHDLSPALFGTGRSPRQTMIYYHGEQVFAVRHGLFKAHFQTKTRYIGQKDAEIHEPPLLFHLGHDPGEQFNIAADHPDVIDKIKAVTQAHKKTVKPVENQLEKR